MFFYLINKSFRFLLLVDSDFAETVATVTEPMMLLNVIRRHMIRSCRRSFDIAAIMIFMYSLWFYMVSGPQNMLQHEVLVARETNSHRRHKPGEASS